MGGGWGWWWWKRLSLLKRCLSHLCLQQGEPLLGCVGGGRFDSRGGLSISGALPAPGVQVPAPRALQPRTVFPKLWAGQVGCGLISGGSRRISAAIFENVERRGPGEGEGCVAASR